MRNNLDVYSTRKVADHYAAYSSALQLPEQTILGILSEKLQNARILDIGIGGGRTVPFLAPNAKEYVGIDFSSAMIKATKSKFDHRYPSARFEVMDARDLSSLRSETFDIVLFSFNGIDNIPEADRNTCLKEMFRVCARGGCVCLSSHNLQNLSEFFSVRFRWHPIKFLKGLLGRRKLLRNNAEQMPRISTASILTIYDDVYDFGLHTVYVKPIYQKQALFSIGSASVRVFALSTGEELKTDKDIETCCDPWIYYLASKA